MTLKTVSKYQTLMMNKGKNKMGILTLLFLVHLQSYAQTIGSFTDNRDGQVYETVTYEVKLTDKSKSTMTWMAENLKYKTENSFCYDDYESNCDIMGRLYDWYVAMKVCPSGWYLPSDEDWYKLTDLYGGVSTAGTHMKSSDELWGRDGEGTNNSLFNATPYGSGVLDNGYYSFKGNAIFWSSTEKNEEYAWDWKVVSSWRKIQRWEGRKGVILNSVRCIQNKKETSE